MINSCIYVRVRIGIQIWKIMVTIPMTHGSLFGLKRNRYTDSFLKFSLTSHLSFLWGSFLCTILKGHYMAIGNKQVTAIITHEVRVALPSEPLSVLFFGHILASLAQPPFWLQHSAHTSQVISSCVHWALPQSLMKFLLE